MTPFDGNAPEMPGYPPIDDRAIDELVAGRGEPADGLPSFVSGVLVAVEAVPPPSPALAAAMAVVAW